MESFYFSLVLILLGVIVGAGVVMGLLRGLNSPASGRPYGAEYGYQPRYLPASDRPRGAEWWGALILFVLALFLLNAGKTELDAWWGKAELNRPTSTAEPLDSTAAASTSLRNDTLSRQTKPSAPPSIDSIYVQIGAYTQRNSAEALQQHWHQQGQTARLCIDTSSASATIYKLWIGPFKNREQAQGFIRQYPQLKGFILSYPAAA